MWKIIKPILVTLALIYAGMFVLDTVKNYTLEPVGKMAAVTDEPLSVKPDQPDIVKVK